MDGQDLFRIRDLVPDLEAISAGFALRSRALAERVVLRTDVP